MNEGKKDRRDPIRTIKARNPVAKNATSAIGGGAAGAHKDKKKAAKQGEVKHKKAEYAEHLEASLRKAMTEDTQQYNKFRVGQRATYKNSRGQEFPVIVTAVDFDDDAVEIKSVDNKPFPNSGGDLTIVVDPGWKFLTPAMRVDPNSVVPASTRESFDSPEYNDESGMARSNLLTLARAVKGLFDTIEKGDNLPEWCQEKIAKSELMLVTVWDYMLSQKAQGIDPKVNKESYRDNRQGFKRREREDDEYHVPDPEVKEDNDPCWKDYKQIGMKTKGGKKVPNCVPKESWTHDSLAAQLFETENTYEDRLSNLLNKRLGK